MSEFSTLYDLPGSQGLQAGVTPGAEVYLIHPATGWQARIADPGALSEVLEQVRADQARAVRRLHPSPRRMAILSILSDGSWWSAPVLAGMLPEPRPLPPELRSELRTMAEDGLARNAGHGWEITPAGRELVTP